jgi:hypothetical protein
MWVVAGDLGFPAATNEVDIYDPLSDSWSVGQPLVNGPSQLRH